jgi:hypothetical protein
MQKSHSVANYKTQQQKLIIPSMRFKETKLFKNLLFTTRMSDLKIIKNHKMMILVVGLQCQGTTKCKGHTVKHKVVPILYTEIL